MGLPGAITYRAMSNPFEPTQHFRAAGSEQLDPPEVADLSEYDDGFEDDLEDHLPATRWHVGLDFGLLVLRIAVGGAMVLAGLYKFGMFNDGVVDMATLPAMLEARGFASATEILAWVLALTEVIGGGLLIVGLLTPLAAAAILGVTATATYLDKDAGYFGEVLEQGIIPGYQFPLVIGAGAVALLFTGPGRIALDVAFPWRKRPVPWGIFGILLGAGSAALVLLLFR